MKRLFFIAAVVFSLSLKAQLTPGTYKIKNAASGKYLRLGNGAADADGLFQFAFADDNSFKWVVSKSSGANSTIKNIRSNKFIAVSGGSTADGAAIIHYDNVGQEDVKWSAVTPTSVGGTIRCKLKNSNSNKMIAVEGGSRADGARIIQWTDNNQPDIVWIFEPTTPSAVPEVRVLKNQWQLALNLVLASMRLKINNYTPTAFQFNPDNTFKYTKPDDCKLTIGFPPNVIENTFNLVPSRFNPATLYFVDINKRSATVIPSGNTLKISMTFEEAGSEVLGNCIDNIICGGGMWWIDLIGMKVDIFLEPTIEAGKLTYRNNARAIVTGTAKSVGMNVIVENLNNAAIFNQASTVFTTILNRADIRNAFTDGLNSNLSRIPVALPNPLTSVRLMPNGDLLFR